MPVVDDDEFEVDNEESEEAPVESELENDDESSVAPEPPTSSACDLTMYVLEIQQSLEVLKLVPGEVLCEFVS